MIKYTSGDYIIVGRIRGKRALLLADKRIDDLKGRGILESSRVTGDDTAVEFDALDVVANLGPTPGTCSAMGVKVEIYFKSFDHSAGTVDCYYPVDKKFKESFESALTDCEDKWTDMLKVRPLLGNIQFELRQPKSIKSIHGLFKAYGGRDELDLIVINADAEHEKLLPHLLHHEFAHAIWHHKFTDAVRASWMELYVTATETTMVSASDSERLYDSWITSEDAVDVWYSAQEESDQQAYDNLIANIGSTFGLRVRDVETLRTQGRTDTLVSIWPESVLVGDMSELVTAYGKKNVEELWCEAFALHMIGTVLPKSVQPLMKRTVTYLKK